MKCLRSLLLMVLVTCVISLSACANQPSLSHRSATQQQDVQQRRTPLPGFAIDPTKIVIGQIVYVPIYSHIYHDNSQKHMMNLSATLSVRNTDLNHAIILSSVRYYDTDGQLLRQDISAPVVLSPLASTSFFVAAEDTRGGSGANFIVEWVAENSVSEPIIEAVMISTSSSQGISFISSGKVIKTNMPKRDLNKST